MTFPLEDCSEFGNFVITLIYTRQQNNTDHYHAEQTGMTLVCVKQNKIQDQTARALNFWAIIYNSCYSTSIGEYLLKNIRICLFDKPQFAINVDCGANVGC